ncbi:hypothetical protein LZ198_00560 [Myxococcus sp. K15C18031901]|uniref:hypothetical protein n=1 Tax=Myxococcus dinghuensis TaxID=2906761 RepID=UPI0020A71C4D|nr:hypothetical protein [Myxococcus dinghuensis]MCP3097356.1 hypothetical protein [Myxococcus dinghuensis]
MMRLMVLAGLVGLLSGCGAGNEAGDTTEQPGAEVQAQDVREQWCNSYKSQQYCPKNVCVWYSTPAPGKCGLPATE